MMTASQGNKAWRGSEQQRRRRRGGHWPSGGPASTEFHPLLPCPCSLALLLQATYELLKRVVDTEMPASTRHLIVMSGVPVVFPRVRGAGAPEACAAVAVAAQCHVHERPLSAMYIARLPPPLPPFTLQTLYCPNA